MISRTHVYAAAVILFVFFVCICSKPVMAQEAQQDNAIETVAEDLSDDLGDDFNDDLGDDFNDDLGDDFNDDLGDDFDDDLGSDFDDSAAPEVGGFDDTIAYQEPLPVAINGHFEVETAVNVAHNKPAQGATDWRGLSKMKGDLQLEIDAALSESWQMFLSGNSFHDFAYIINEKDNYTQEVLDEHEHEAQLRKAYIQGRLLKSLDIKVGRQIIVWGRSDNMRVTDILNPLDLREPGLTDIEDLRMPVTMTRLDFYHGDWNITGVALHENRTDRNPAFGSDFYPLPLRYGPLPDKEPESDIDNTGFALAVNGVFSGWDLSFYAADLYSHTPYVAVSPLPEFRYADITMAGTALNVTTGNWLFKTEVAYFTGIRLSDTVGSGNTDEYSRIDALAGVEYMGFTETSLNVDILNSHYTDFNDAAEVMGGDENSFQTVARITRDFFNETLNLTLLASVYGNGDDGALFRLTAEYDLTDNIEVIGGGVNYKSGDRPEFENIGNNDRLYCNIKCSF